MSPAPSLRRILVVALLSAAAGGLVAADDESPIPDALSAGGLTTVDAGATAYLQPVAALDDAGRKQFAEGHKLFNTHWVFYWFEGGMWGRGPTSNADSCVACHQGNGRGTPQSPEDAARAASLECSSLPREIERDSLPQLACRRVEASPLSLIVRLSLPGTTRHGGPKPHPDYGDQLQTFGVPRLLPAEGTVQVTWNERSIALADGEIVTLRAPDIRVSEPGVQRARQGHHAVAPGRARADRHGPAGCHAGCNPSPARGTGIAGWHAGKTNVVWDIATGKPAIGRFGLKANHPNLRQQIAAAFIGDIGLSSSLFPEQNCPPIQKVCKEMMFAGNPEITSAAVGRGGGLPAHAGGTGAPQCGGHAGRAWRELFGSARCTVCHVPELRQATIRPSPCLPIR